MANKGKSIKLKIDENDHLLYSKNEFDGFLSAAHLREDNNKIEKFSTGSSSRDNILAERIETGSIT